MPQDLTVGIRLTADGKGFVGEMRLAGRELGKLAGSTDRASAASRRLARTTGQAEAATRRAGAGFLAAHGRLLQYATSALSAGTALGVMRSALAATVRQEAALAQVEARIRSTGGAAGLTAGDLADMAAALQRTTTFGDEAILEAQSVLLSFRNIAGDAFAGATRAALNLSTALGQDLRSTVVQLGKALDDPARGLDALSRSGTTFTARQREMIKAMVEAGDVAGAQAAILRELEQQYGGAAEAARDTLGGALAALRNAFGDLTEVGEDRTGALTGVILDLADTLERVDVDTLHDAIADLEGPARIIAYVVGVRLVASLATAGAQALWAAGRTRVLSVAATGAAARVDVARLRLLAGARAARTFGGAVGYASIAVRGLNRAILTGPLGTAALIGYGIYELTQAVGDVDVAMDDAGQSADEFARGLQALNRVQLEGLEIRILSQVEDARDALGDARAVLDRAVAQEEAARRQAAAASGLDEGGTAEADANAAAIEAARRARRLYAAAVDSAMTELDRLERRQADVTRRLGEIADPSLAGALSGRPDGAAVIDPIDVVAPPARDPDIDRIAAARAAAEDRIARATLDRISLINRAERQAAGEQRAILAERPDLERQVQAAIAAIRTDAQLQRDAVLQDQIAAEEQAAQARIDATRDAHEARIGRIKRRL